MAGSTQIELSIDFEILSETGTATFTVGSDFDFTLELGPRSLGDLIDFLIQLAEPSRTLHLEAPWDQLLDLQLTPTFTWKSKADQQSVGFALAFDQPFTAIPELELDGGCIVLQRDVKNSQKQVMLSLKGKLFGQPFAPPDVDLLRHPPPTPAPQTPPVFQLDYLGLGQHVSLAPSQPTDMADVISALMKLSVPTDTNPLSATTALQFDAASNWLIGIQFSLKFLTLSAIFNDPNLYGLRLDFSGQGAPQLLQGFSFEILYRKVSDNIGVYHIELKLPDEIRQIDVGEASLTLPIIDIDIFTNGNFLIDFGFPWNGDYSRSLTFQVIIILPVTGAGGFYFGVLDPQTAAAEGDRLSIQLPTPVPPGSFGPLIVFGIAAQMGLGKTIQKGILTAGFALVVEASLEGALAVYDPGNGGTQSAYFKVTGSVGLTIHLFGEINFGIIRARLDVLADASIQLVYEVYQPIIITAHADVSVALEVEVNLGLIHFNFSLSFSASITETFQIGHVSTPPWQPQPVVVAPQERVATSIAPRRAFAIRKTAAAAAPATSKTPITLYFQPMLTVAMVGGAAAAPQLVAMLFIEAPAPGAVEDVSTDFEKLLPGVLAEVLRAHTPSLLPPTRNGLQAFLEKLAATPLTFADISAALDGFTFDLLQVPNPAPALAAFPMLPSVVLSSTLQYTTVGGDTLASIAKNFGVDPGKLTIVTANVDLSKPLPTGTFIDVPGIDVDFSNTTRCGSDYSTQLGAYFSALSASTESIVFSPAGPTDPSMASVLLADYLQAAIGELVRTAIENIAVPLDNTHPFTYTSAPADTLADISSRFGIGIALLQNANPGLDPVKPLGVVSVDIPDSPPQDLSSLLPGLAALSSSSDSSSSSGTSASSTSAGSSGSSASSGSSGSSSSGSSNSSDSSGSSSSSASPSPSDSSSDASSSSSSSHPSGPYGPAARSAAAFLLHGLRLPVPGGSTQNLSPLYVLSGQQSAAPPLTSVNSFVFTATQKGQAPLNVALSASDLGTIQGALASSFDPTQRIAEKIQYPPYSIQPRMFPLGKPVLWSDKGAAPPRAIFVLPASLRTQIAASPQSAARLNLMSAGAATAGSIPPPPVSKTGTWYTQVDFSIQRIPDPAATGQFLSSAYQITGADFEGRDDLESLIDTLTAAANAGVALNPTVELLYPADPSSPSAGLMSDPTPTVTLLKSNLSTGVHEAAAQEDDSFFTASPFGSDPRHFLTLLWECSVVATGGYTLIYTKTATGGDPLAALFVKDPTVRLTLMATVAETANPARSLHNCVVSDPPGDSVYFIQASPVAVSSGDTLQSIAGNLLVRDAIGTAAQPAAADVQAAVESLGAANATTPGLFTTRIAGDLLTAALIQSTTVTSLVDSNATTPLTAGTTLLVGIQCVSRRARIAAGSTGFRVLMNAIGQNSTALEKQYSMLGYWVKAAGGFHQSNDGVPVPPAADGVTLDRVISIAALAKAPKPGLLTVQGPDPYGGIGTSAFIGMQPQDVFGNRCVADDSAPMLEIPVAYRDELIGLSRWPRIQASYYFDGQEPTPQLVVQLTLNPPNRGDNVAADLDSYRQIYFQLVQDDVTVSAATSLGTTGTADIKTPLIGFAAAAHAFLSGSGQPPAATIRIPVTPAFPDPVFNLTASIAIARTAHVDPYFEGFDRVQTVSSDLKPRTAATAGGDETGLLRDFARQFQRVFPELLLAMGGDLSAIDPNSRTKVLVAVHLKAGSLNFTPKNDPRFFAVKPLATVPWSADSVPIQAYTNGVLAADPNPAMKNFRGIDLDSWGSDFLSTLDLFLAPRLASLAQGVPPGSADTAFTVAMTAKTTLAQALRNNLAEVLGTSIDVPVDVQDTLYESLLVSLSSAYTVDAVIQFPVTVDNTSSDHTLRLNLQPVGVNRKIQASDTVASLAAAIDVPMPFFQTFISAIPGIFDTAGNLTSGAILDVFVKTYKATADDDLRSVIDYLAAPIPDAAGLQTAISHFVAMNGSAQGLFAARSVTISRGTSHAIVSTDTLTDIAAALRVAPEAFVNDALDTAGLIQAQAVFNFPARAPGFTLSAAQTDQGTPFLTTLFHTASPGDVRNMSLNLACNITGLERNVVSPAFAPRYESSEWLSFLLPLDPLAIGSVNIPIPLRAVPVPPTLVSQAFDQKELPSNPPLADLVNYEYSYTYSYARAAQDRLFARISANVDNPVPFNPDKHLPLSLAQYYSIAPDLKRDLAAGNATAIATFATLASEIATDWADWCFSPPSAPPGSTFLVQDSTEPDGTRVTTLQPMNGATLNVVIPPAGSTPVPADTFTHLVPEQNVIDTPSIAGSVSVTRNARLVPKTDTQSGFVYMVPDVRFPSPAIPLLRYSEPIDVIAAPDWPKNVPADLASVLTQLFTLVLHLPPTGSASAPFIRLAVAYEFVLAQGPGGVPGILTAVPVLMRPKFQLSDPGGFSKQLATELNKWLTDNQVSTGGHWVLDLSLYAAADSISSTPPLLEITNLRLPSALLPKEE